jgi:hypothetical protein
VGEEDGGEDSFGGDFSLFHAIINLKINLAKCNYL